MKYHILALRVAVAALDGIYVIRTALPKKQISAPDALRSLKSLAQVERAFRWLKTVDLKIRPIHHRLESWVRAHIFLCMLAYYVEWHMIEFWRLLLFANENRPVKATRDPVALAECSDAALDKVHTRNTADGTRAHSLCTFIAEVVCLVRNTCRTPDATDQPQTIEILTKQTPFQRRAFELLEIINA